MRGKPTYIFNWQSFGLIYRRNKLLKIQWKIGSLSFITYGPGWNSKKIHHSLTDLWAHVKPSSKSWAAKLFCPHYKDANPRDKCSYWPPDYYPDVSLARTMEKAAGANELFNKCSWMQIVIMLLRPLYMCKYISYFYDVDYENRNGHLHNWF